MSKGKRKNDTSEQQVSNTRKIQKKGNNSKISSIQVLNKEYRDFLRDHGNKTTATMHTVAPNLKNARGTRANPQDIEPEQGHSSWQIPKKKTAKVNAPNITETIVSNNFDAISEADDEMDIENNTQKITIPTEPELKQRAATQKLRQYI